MTTEPKTKIAYCCDAAFDFEVEGDTQGTTFYPSLEAIRAAIKCCNSGSCSVYEVEIRKIKVVQKGHHDRQGR